MSEQPTETDAEYWKGYLAYAIGATVNGDHDLEYLEGIYREFMAIATITPELRATLPPVPPLRPLPLEFKRRSRRRGLRRRSDDP